MSALERKMEKKWIHKHSMNEKILRKKDESLKKGEMCGRRLTMEQQLIFNEHNI